MSLVINNLTVGTGMGVTFYINSKVDKQKYRGTVVGVVGFDAARIHEDIVANHNNMESSIAAKQIVAQQFILLKTSDGAIRPFASIWIKESSFEQTDNTADAKIIVYGVTSLELAQILNFIRDLGHECEEL